MVSFVLVNSFPVLAGISKVPVVSTIVGLGVKLSLVRTLIFLSNPKSLPSEEEEASTGSLPLGLFCRSRATVCLFLESYVCHRKGLASSLVRIFTRIGDIGALTF